MTEPSCTRQDHFVFEQLRRSSRSAPNLDSPTGRSSQRVRKYAFDQEVTLSAVMVDAIEAWLDQREG